MTTHRSPASCTPNTLSQGLRDISRQAVAIRFDDGFANMTTDLEAWLQFMTAKTSEELQAGDGRHPEEIDALRQYLNGKMTAHEAAVAMMGPTMLREDYSDPPVGLLVETLVEHGQEVSRLSLELLVAIQALPITWPEYPAFGHMWHDQYDFYPHKGTDPRSAGDNTSEMYRYYEDLGVAEAFLWLRIPDAINPLQGYGVLNLACLGCDDIQVFLHQIYGWLKIAGPQLRLHRDLDEGVVLPKREPGRNRANIAMEEHWNEWESSLVDLSGNGSTLPADSRRLAGECLAIMRDAKKQDSRSPGTKRQNVDR